MVTTESTRQFGCFFIYLCVFVYSLAIQNIFNSFQDIKERGNRLVAVEDIQRSGIFKPTLQEQPLLGFLGEDDCAEFVLSVLLKAGKLDVVADCEPIVKFWLQQRDQNNRHPQPQFPVLGPAAAAATLHASAGRSASVVAAGASAGAEEGNGRGRRSSLNGTPYAAELAAARTTGQQRPRLERQVEDFLAMKAQRAAVERAQAVQRRSSVKSQSLSQLQRMEMEQPLPPAVVAAAAAATAGNCGRAVPKPEEL